MDSLRVAELESAAKTDSLQIEQLQQQINELETQIDASKEQQAVAEPEAEAVGGDAQEEEPT